MLVEEWLYMIGGIAVFLAYVKWLHNPLMDFTLKLFGI
jgi:hypothetical protein